MTRSSRSTMSGPFFRISRPSPLTPRRLYALIERAYTRANAALLRLLLHTRELGARLRALRATFFLSQAPGIPAFLDTAAGELRKSARGASVPRLQSLLELARAAARDDALQDVRVVLASAGLYDWLLKIVGQRGALDEGGLGLTASASGGAEPDAERREKEKKEEKALAGLALSLSCLLFIALTHL
jgi:gamma-tubulin complex component 2